MKKLLLIFLLASFLLYWASAHREIFDTKTDSDALLESTSTESTSSTKSLVDISSTIDWGSHLRSTEPSTAIVALEESSDVLTALNEDASSGLLTSSQFLVESASWSFLCERVFHADLRPWLDEREVPESFRQEVTEVCAGFTANYLSSMNQAAEEEHETSLAVSEATYFDRPLMQLLQIGDLDAARDHLFEDIYDALSVGRFAHVEGYLWEIHLHGLLEPLPAALEGNLSVQPVEYVVTSAIALALSCQRLGGCRPNHPLVINFCLYYPDRRCRPPVDAYDAIDQILTGYEIEYFNHMLRQVEAGLRLVRYG